MPALKIKKNQFTGGKATFDANDGLTSAIRKLAQDLARTRINSFADIVDNTTGSPDLGGVLKPQAGSSIAAYTETGTTSAPKAGFDTAIGKTRAAMSVMAAYLNRINASLGLPLISDSIGGTIAAEGTLPAQDKTLTAVSSSCLDVVTARVTLDAVRLNMARLSGYVNRVAVAVGEKKLVKGLGRNFDANNLLIAIPSSGTAVSGASLSTVQNSVINTELTSIADNLATMATLLLDITGAQLSDLTGTPGGTASINALVAQAVPAAATGAATTSSPKAGFDTAIGKIEENLSELATRVNLLLRRNNLGGLLTINTGVTADGALVAQDTNLTAVDGSSGTVAVDQVTGRARLGTINDATVSIASKVNALATVYGLPALSTAALTGTVSTTIADIAATGTGVSGANATLLDTDVDAFLLASASNISSLMAKLNEMTSASVITDVPLQVVAFDV